MIISISTFFTKRLSKTIVMSELTQALKKFSFWIENSQSSHAHMIRSYPTKHEGIKSLWSLKPGLEREMIELYVEEMNLELPEEIYELYQWHNGNFEIGDYANPVSFPSFEDAFYRVFDWGFKKFPIFLGDDCHYAIDPVKRGQRTSPIRFYEESGISQNDSNISSSFYAPSLTNVIKAVVECAEKYDKISIYYGDFDSTEQRQYQSQLITQIYKKYGVVGQSCGLWR